MKCSLPVVEYLQDRLDPDVRDGFDQADLCARLRSVRGRDSASFVRMSRTL